MRRLHRRLFVSVALLVSLLSLAVWQWSASSTGRSSTPASAAGSPVASAASYSSGSNSASLSHWLDRIRAASPADYAALADELLRLSDPDVRQAALAELLRLWLHADAHAFNKYFMALEVENDVPNLNLLADALKVALTQLDDDAAASDAVKDLVRRLVMHLARHDPDAALAWANDWLLDDTRDAALVQIARSLTQRSPAEGLQVVAQIAAPLRRMQGLAAVGGIWARTDSAAALRWAAALLRPTEQALALNSVLLTLAHGDARAAAAELAAHERRMAEDYRARYERDLAAMNLTPADLANAPEKYRELLEAGALPPPTSPDVELLAEAARVIASRLGETGDRMGAAWAESLNNDLLRLHAARGALAGWSHVDPAAAVAYFNDHYASYPELVGSLYENWAAADAANAAAGTRLLGDAALRATAVESVASAWATRDSTGAANWLDQLPATDRTDAARLAVVYGLAETQPAQAWSRALQIQDSALQYRGLKAAFANLLTQDVNQARRLLESSPLTPRINERLLDVLREVEGG